jgi:hypothetical protein
MTPTIILLLIVSIVAIAAVAAAMRVAYLTAGGRFEERPAPATSEPAEDLELAA